jgi:hypothetical protein
MRPTTKATTTVAHYNDTKTTATATSTWTTRDEGRGSRCEPRVFLFFATTTDGARNVYVFSHFFIHLTNIYLKINTIMASNTAAVAPNYHDDDDGTGLETRTSQVPGIYFFLFLFSLYLHVY